MYTMITIGVDGAKRGWVYSIVERDRVLEIGFMEHFRFLGFPTLVDIPIGLPKKGERECDKLARKILSKRAASVFTVPCRAAVYQESYEDALRVNRECQGKGFPVQFWHIVEKVREVDVFFRSHPDLSDQIRESHPELCFLRISSKMMESKHTREGLNQRIKALRKHLVFDVENLQKICREHKIYIHDVLDSLVLALTQQFPLETIPEDPPLDEHGLPMQIIVPARTQRSPNPG
ncbi:MAG: Uncharacterized protein XD64_1305 [Thermotoga sp. 47_83]|jgi:predicted RNase H-like nuclease|uniref:Uncharacterized protein n=2 Tax=Thermotoga petrophila TaxID=93929 RepID=A0A101ERY3_9THEM|nr:MAG: Uncharacterized protein XD57_0135 [Thermotoga petrophila]KUK32867.1 MAG: Uncharacterized protein XD64_1305 [Thermotoga sp. 47_83]MBZ4661051.1 hypothetical protein [Thermotoga sp.]MDK2898725.1 hypothetical protein [Thermotoga sp.]HBU00829.1 DUF429 domain-containing protein [Thermotoga petrophila]